MPNTLKDKIINSVHLNISDGWDETFEVPESAALDYFEEGKLENSKKTGISNFVSENATEIRPYYFDFYLIRKVVYLKKCTRLGQYAFNKAGGSINLVLNSPCYIETYAVWHPIRVLYLLGDQLSHVEDELAIGNCDIYVPANLYDQYLEAEDWQPYIAQIKVYDGEPISYKESSNSGEE